MIYVGHHYGEPEDFELRLKSALSDAFGEAVELQYFPTARDIEELGTWPAGVSPPEEGKMTVLLRAPHRFRCGTGAMAMLTVSLFTAGIVPYLDGDSLLWSTEIFDGPDHRAGIFPFEVSWGRYGWLPLTPLVPLNIVWRQMRGGEHDYFLRVYPAHLRWQIGWRQTAGLQWREELSDRSKSGAGLH